MYKIGLEIMKIGELWEPKRDLSMSRVDGLPSRILEADDEYRQPNSDVEIKEIYPESIYIINLTTQRIDHMKMSYFLDNYKKVYK